MRVVSWDRIPNFEAFVGPIKVGFSAGTMGPGGIARVNERQKKCPMLEVLGKKPRGTQIRIGAHSQIHSLGVGRVAVTVRSGH